MPAYQKKGFIVGLALFFILLFIPAPDGLNATAWTVAAIAVLMAVWWATEAIPVAVTALLPLALFPLMDVTSFESAAVPYANKNIYLFDLRGYASLLLKKLGFFNVWCSNHDTYAQKKDFFSYRRSKHNKLNDYGRMISVIKK